MKRFSLLIPTKGERIKYLNELFNSIKNLQDFVDIYLICPKDAFVNIRRGINDLSFDFTVIEDPDLGLAHAINCGLNEVKTSYWNWIGDDDLIEPSNYRDFLEYILKTENIDKEIAFYSAGCAYIDKSGKILSNNYPKKYAPIVARVGPNLFSQPSLMFKTDLVRSVGGLDESYRFAFDQELIMNLLPKGKIVTYPYLVSYYRWHSLSLTNLNRNASFLESYQIRMKHASHLSFQIIIKLLYLPTRIIIRLHSMLLRINEE
jgi:GT2 family glycosyltransferase